MSQDHPLKGKKPDWEIRTLNIDTDERGLIGVGWTQPDGSISVAFNPFVTVPVGKRFATRLFPARAEERPTPVRPKEGLLPAQGRHLDMDDEIPF